MRRHIFRMLASFIGLLLFYNLSSAGDVKRGQVGFRFLEHPVSAEVVGRGGLGINLTQNSNSAFWNPAGLEKITTRLDFNANYTNGIADINHSALVGAVSLWGYVFALDMFTMDYGDLQGTRRANNEKGFVDTEPFTPQASVIGISMGKSVTDRFSFGVKLKSAYQNLGMAYLGTAGSDVDDPEFEMETKKYHLREWAMDIGTLYDFGVYGIRFGVIMKNISREAEYVEEKFPLPYAISFSLTTTPMMFIPSLFGNPEVLTVGIETEHPRDLDERIKFGAEYTVLEVLILRLGYMQNFDQRGFTFGFGVTQSVLRSTLRINYAFQDFGLFNSVHYLSFGMGMF